MYISLICYCITPRGWQAVTAAGTGCTAALAAERYLTANGLLKEVHQQRQKDGPKVVKEVEKTVRSACCCRRRAILTRPQKDSRW